LSKKINNYEIINKEQLSKNILQHTVNIEKISWEREDIIAVIESAANITEFVKKELTNLIINLDKVNDIIVLKKIINLIEKGQTGYNTKKPHGHNKLTSKVLYNKEGKFPRIHIPLEIIQVFSINVGTRFIWETQYGKEILTVVLHDLDQHERNIGGEIVRVNGSDYIQIPPQFLEKNRWELEQVTWKYNQEGTIFLEFK
jgi:hypothetical protein